MEDFKILIDMVKDLPHFALWVIAAILAYKVIVIGSIYGVIRFCVGKAVEAYSKPREYSMQGMLINDSILIPLLTQLGRLKATSYFHATDVAKLKTAIDLLEAQERAKK